MFGFCVWVPGIAPEPVELEPVPVVLVVSVPVPVVPVLVLPVLVEPVPVVPVPVVGVVTSVPVPLVVSLDWARAVVLRAVVLRAAEAMSASNSVFIFALLLECALECGLPPPR
jgi:hypothetical protein